MTSQYLANDGFLRVAGCTPQVALANPEQNLRNIIDMASSADAQGASIILFPELSLSGYTCGDLFHQIPLLEECLSALHRLAIESKRWNAAVVVGLPIEVQGHLYNCAAVVAAGEVKGVVPKSFLPNYNEFYERRWFSEGKNLPADHITIPADESGSRSVPFGTDLLFMADGVRFGIEICEDLWVPIPPSSLLTQAGADIILNLSATDELLGKHRYLRNLVSQQSARCRCAYLYASAAMGESSTDLSISGNVIIAEDGGILAESERFALHPQCIMADVDVARLRRDRLHFNTYFDPSLSAGNIRIIPTDISNAERATTSTLLREVDPHPFVPSSAEHLRENCEEIISIQSWGLEQRLRATGCKCLIVGISGGLDSTLALLIAVRAFSRLGLDLKGIIGVTMPGEATSDRTYNNAWQLMHLLGITSLEIPIGAAVAQHFKDIEQDPTKYDATYENSQARERTQILMDMANKHGGMVLGTGDLSELALGWCTYNGDHMSMYAVNASVPKTLVRHLVEYFASIADNPEVKRILLDIADTPISPELVPATKEDSEEIAQKTEDLVGPYQLHDFFLFHTLRLGETPAKVFRLAKIAFEGIYTPAVIKHWMLNFYRRFFSQQFKRSCLPDGPKVGSVCLSPRGDWRMPSDASSRLWIAQTEQLPV